MHRTLPWVVLSLAACQSDAAAPRQLEPSAQALAGVWPEKFDCGSIATTDTLTQLLGAKVRAVDTPSSIPRGLARPCTYEAARPGAAAPEHWTYDFDCRDGYKQRADALFEQYKRYNADRIAEYNRVTDAPPAVPASKAKDAGVADVKPPGGPSEVAVGAKGLDHNDQAILFIDDDAPCYVRVTGPDAARRLELAKLVAKNLTFQSAPMTPRAAK